MEANLLRSVLLTFALFSAGVLAHADTYHFNLANVTSTAEPFGTVTLSDQGIDTVHVTVSLASGLAFVNRGYQASFAFNLLGNPKVAFKNVTKGWNAIDDEAESYKFGPLGEFEYGLNCDACRRGASNPFSGPLEFDLITAGLTSEAFKEKTQKGFYVGADVVDSKAQNSPMAAIGAGDDPVIGSVPEPASIVLFGSVLTLISWRLRSGRRFGSQSSSSDTDVRQFLNYDCAIDVPKA